MTNGPDGVKIIFETNKARPQSWYFQGTHEARFKVGAEVNPRKHMGDWILNSDGSYSLLDNSDVFAQVETIDTSGIIGVDQATNSAKGYMRNARDWNNIEAHGYFFLESLGANTPAIFSIGCHGGPRVINKKGQGTAYEAQLFKSGETRFAKCLWWPMGYTYQPSKSVTTDIIGRWIGFKFICISLAKNRVKLLIYIDEGNVTNNWMLVNSFVDSGGWAIGSNGFGGEPDQVLDYGGPIVFFKWRGMDITRVKNLAVREVVNKQSANDPVTEQGSGLGSQAFIASGGEAYF